MPSISIDPSSRNARDLFLQYWLPVILYMAGIFWLSSMPSPPGARYLAADDKIAHLLAYFFLTLVVWRAFTHAGGLFRNQPYLWAFLLVITYGASDEFHQRYVPYRMSDVKDWVADCLGAALMLVLIVLWRQVVKRTCKPGGSP